MRKFCSESEPASLSARASDFKDGFGAAWMLQRVCMKRFSQSRVLMGYKSHSHGQVVFAHGGLEIGQRRMAGLGMA